MPLKCLALTLARERWTRFMSPRALLASLAPLALVVLAGCASSAGPHAAALERTFRPGEQITLADGSTLRYVRLVNDSRCPVDVQCVWAGDAEVLFELTSASGTVESVPLKLTAPARAVGSGWVHLLELQRGMNTSARLRIDQTPPASP